MLILGLITSEFSKVICCHGNTTARFRIICNPFELKHFDLGEWIKNLLYCFKHLLRKLILNYL